MTQQTINLGTAPNSGTGDPLRSAFTKCNQNFTDLYSLFTGGGSLTGPITIAAGASGPTLTVNAATGSNGLVVTGAGSLVANFLPSGTTEDSIQLANNNAGGQGSMAFRANNALAGRFGAAGTTNQIVTGSAAGDMCLNVASTGNIRFGTAGTDRFDILTTGDMVSSGVTGGGKGAGTLNAAGLFVNGVAVGGATYNFVVKNADTSRNTTTTLADDPDLQLALAAGHVFEIAFALYFNQAVGGTTGLGLGVRYSTNVPDFTTLFFPVVGQGSGSTYQYQNLNMSYGAGYGTAVQVLGSTVGTGATYTCVSSPGFIFPTTGGGSGTFIIGWAQTFSDAHNATIKAGSFIRWRQII